MRCVPVRLPAAHLSASEGHLTCLQYLVASGASVAHVLGARNDQGETPRDLAAQFGKSTIVEYIVRVEKERDAAPPGSAPDLAYPAHAAAFEGRLDDLKGLVESGVVNVNERDDQGVPLPGRSGLIPLPSRPSGVTGLSRMRAQGARRSTRPRVRAASRWCSGCSRWAHAQTSSV